MAGGGTPSARRRPRQRHPRVRQQLAAHPRRLDTGPREGRIQLPEQPSRGGRGARQRLRRRPHPQPGRKARRSARRERDAGAGRTADHALGDGGNTRRDHPGHPDGTLREDPQSRGGGAGGGPHRALPRRRDPHLRLGRGSDPRRLGGPATGRHGDPRTPHPAAPGGVLPRDPGRGPEYADVLTPVY